MSKFNIGDIVSTNGHPYFKNITDIKIAGDPVNVIPLMVVIEIFYDTHDSFSEDTGEKLSSKGDGKCKCLWFSLKSNTFNDAWFNFAALKVIDTMPGLDLRRSETNDLAFKKRILKEYLNRDVLFKTSFLELKKIKETKLHNKSLDRIADHTSLLNFVCPILQIVDVKLSEEKSSVKYDVRTGDSRRKTTDLFFKCRYYNATAEKWSEIPIPAEALASIQNVDREVENISNDINKKKLYSYDYTQEQGYNEQEKEPLAILEIIDLTYLNGLYNLKTYDLIHQDWKILEVPLAGIVDTHDKDSIFLADCYPNFDFKRGDKSLDPEKLLEEFTEFINESEGNVKYLMITYLNKSDKITQRVVKDFFVVPGLTKKASTYLQAFCCKKREMRSFNFTTLRGVKRINLK